MAPELVQPTTLPAFCCSATMPATSAPLPVMAAVLTQPLTLALERPAMPPVTPAVQETVPWFWQFSMTISEPLAV